MTRLLKPPGCDGCVGLEWTPKRDGFSNNEGHGTNAVLCVGEALGRNEEDEGLPFRPGAQAGSLLERAFKRLGYSRDMFRITNVLRCRPPNDWLAEAPYEFEVIQHCRPYLTQELTTMKPRVILALGGTATRELTGLAGAKLGVSHIRGYVVPSSIPQVAGTPVVPTFHPSFIRQGNHHLEGVLYHDIQRAVTYAKQGGEFQTTHYESKGFETPCPDCGGKSSAGCFLCDGTGVYTRTLNADFTASEWLPVGAAPLKRVYQLRPGLDDARAFVNRIRDNPNLPLTYDIETPGSAEADEDERDELYDSTITQAQLSLMVGEGTVFPWEGTYIDLYQEALALPNLKYSFYGHLFDDPQLRAAGCTFGGPPTHDLYEMWHHMQPDLPANLQFVASFYGMDVAGPWKHLAQSDSAFYGCADVDAPQRILARLPEQLRKRGLWDGYERLVYRVRPILDCMSERGIPINDERRVAFGLELDKAAAEVDVEMQQLVPEECRNVHPKQGYKKVPKDTTGLTQRMFDVTKELASPIDPLDSAHSLRWCRIEPFKPSSQQLIRYMRFKGHPVPVNIKKGRETSEAKELERLAKKTHDPLYRKVIWYREVRLMKATFVDGWAPKSDGRVHTTFTFAPATGQTSSRDPNVQNAPEHAKEGREAEGLADKFQRIIEAPPGYKIVSFDHKSFHALTLAYLAQDPDYERIVRLDIHSFVAARFLKLKRIDEMMGYTNDELREFLKWVKREHTFTRDFKCKRIILGWGFGRGYRSIYNAYMESFAGESEVKQIVHSLEDSFPRTVKFRKSIMQKAHYDTCLVSPFKFIRWFWDVYSFDPKTGRLRNGDQAEQAIAFLPANCAFGMMREEALEMTRQGLDERFGLINTIHDSYKFVCADPLVEECVHTIAPLMEAKCPALKSPLHPEGLWCAVSASVGQNNARRTYDNPDGREEVIVHDAPSVAASPS